MTAEKQALVARMLGGPLLTPSGPDIRPRAEQSFPGRQADQEDQEDQADQADQDQHRPRGRAIFPRKAGRPGRPGRTGPAQTEGQSPLSVLVLVLLVLVCLCAHGFGTTDCEKACSACLPGKERSAPRREGPAEGPRTTCIAPKRAQGV